MESPEHKDKAWRWVGYVKGPLSSSYFRFEFKLKSCLGPSDFFILNSKSGLITVHLWRRTVNGQHLSVLDLD